MDEVESGGKLEALRDRVRSLSGAAKRVIDKQGRVPFYLTHFVTGQCNFACEHCFYWDQLNQNKDELTLDEIRRIAASCKGVSFVILTGGEPFLRKDFAEIVAAWHQIAGVPRISIPTNAYLTHKIVASVREILLANPRLELTVVISIDGLAEVHDAIRRRPGSFERLLRTYDALAELSVRHPKLGMTVVTTYNRDNQHQVDDLYTFVRRRMPRAYFSMNMIRGKPKDVSLMEEMDVGPYRALARKIADDRISPRNIFLGRLSAAKFATRYELIADVVESGRFQTPCYAGSLSGVLDETGNVSACEMLSHRIGNVRDEAYDMRRIWRRESAEQIRRWIEDTDCFCTHECPLTTNILFNPKFYPRLVARALRPGRSEDAP